MEADKTPIKPPTECSTTPPAGLSGVSTAKHRRVRRGTSSCWECKRRKVRCDFEPSLRTVCVGCRRRGSRCVPQNVLLEHDPTSSVEDRIGHVESLVDRLLTQSNAGAQPDPIGCKSRRNTPGARKQLLRQLLEPSDAGRDQYYLSSRPPTGMALSVFVHSNLPSPVAATLIITQGRHVKLSMGQSKDPYKALSSPAVAGQTLEALPSPSAHPIALADKLMQLAICLQQMDPRSDLSALRLGRSSCSSVRDVADHYFCIATRYVTSQDRLVASLDGLDSLVLEATYHLNAGNSYHGWLTCRRALGMANRLELCPSTERPKVGAVKEKEWKSTLLWFRLVYIERLLSLMLGLPTTVVGDGMFTTATQATGEVPQGKLDRMHNLIIGRILARDQKMILGRRNCSAAELWDGWKETEDIDCDLRRAKRLLPIQWWAEPLPPDGPPDRKMLDDATRILSHIHHFYLVIFAHLPFVAPSVDPFDGVAVESLAPVAARQPNYVYSRFTAAHASYELISRFIVFQDFKFAPLCGRGGEAKIVTAALTLLLAHICSHGQGRANMLEHRRSGDLDMVERAIARLEAHGRLQDDSISCTCAAMLRRLVEVENEASDGIPIDCRWTHERPGAQLHLRESLAMKEMEQQLKILVPYFGTITVVRVGIQGLSTLHDGIEISSGERSPLFGSLDQQVAVDDWQFDVNYLETASDLSLWPGPTPLDLESGAVTYDSI